MDVCERVPRIVAIFCFVIVFLA